jgi:uncharacterized protein YbjQ (UPF0145 family)
MSHTSARNILISTTPELEGWEVKSYLDVVSSHVVAGTNIFSDIAASFSDVFGGRSKSYKRQLESIKEEALKELKEEASQLGADAIVGVKLDHDQISGQNKGMLMVTGSGTAVTTERNATEELPEDGQRQTGPVSARELQTELKKENLLAKTDSENAFQALEDEWQFVIENQVDELAAPIVDAIEHIQSKSLGGDYYNQFKERARDYFLTVPSEVTKEQLYRMVTHKDRRVMTWARDVLSQGRLLDFGWINGLLDEDRFLSNKRALEVLVRIDKTYYTEEDIQKFEAVKKRIETEFEKIGEVLEVEESGMFSSEEKEVWEIEEGARNPMDRKYCEETGLNIYGFSRKETKPEEAIHSIERKVQALRKQFNRAENGQP